MLPPAKKILLERKKNPTLKKPNKQEKMRQESLCIYSTQTHKKIIFCKVVFNTFASFNFSVSPVASMQFTYVFLLQWEFFQVIESCVLFCLLRFFFHSQCTYVCPSLFLLIYVVENLFNWTGLALCQGSPLNKVETDKI